MHIADQEVLLKSPVEGSVVVRWPVKYLRAYKNEPASTAGVKGKHLLTLEVGRSVLYCVICILNLYTITIQTLV